MTAIVNADLKWKFHMTVIWVLDFFFLFLEIKSSPQGAQWQKDSNTQNPMVSKQLDNPVIALNTASSSFFSNRSLSTCLLKTSYPCATLFKTKVELQPVVLSKTVYTDPLGKTELMSILLHTTASYRYSQHSDVTYYMRDVWVLVEYKMWHHCTS